MNRKKRALTMIQTAIERVNPEKLILNQVRITGQRLWIREHALDLSGYQRIYVIGLGKAAAPMARALEKILDQRLTGGGVVVKYGHKAPLRKITLYEAGHPLPDENSLLAAEQMLSRIGTPSEKDLFFVLISGGGSAVFEKLPPDVSLEDYRQVNKALLSCGASIEEINTVRKHLSLVKGGQLARLLYPGTVVALILSDVIGDPLESIASGPVTPDPSTFSQVHDIFEKYRLWEQLPSSVIDHVQKGLAGRIPETPKADEKIFKRVQSHILGNNYLALRTLAEESQRQGIKSLILTDRIQGEARQVARVLAAVIESALQHSEPVAAPAALFSGGEPTVTLKGKGLGGRNQELALAVVLALQHCAKPFFFCSVGTDGTDGPTDAAGAWVDEKTLTKARSLGLDAQKYLDNNDSYHFFQALDQLIKTGPTGTNVMDVQLAFI